RNPRELHESGLGPNGHGRRRGAALGGRGRGHSRLVEPPSLERPQWPVLSRSQTHPVVIGRHRLVVLALVALLLAACSVSRLVYLNAPPLALWYVGGYVDMSDAQKSFLEDRFTRAMAWHRENELPAYRRTIEGLVPKLDGKLSADDARATYVQARDYYHRALERLLPDFADFLLMIDVSQVPGVEKKFAEDNRKMLKESVRGTPDDRRARRAKRFVDEFEDWTGRLSRAQRDLIVSRARTLADNTEERLGDRKFRQSEILRIVRTKPPREEAI